MSNYVKATNFYTKDALSTGNPSKLIKGAEIDDEFNAISTAISSKADTTSPTFTGTPIAPTATAGNNTTQIATTAFVKGATDALGNMSTQNKSAVDITGGTIVGTFTGNLTGNVTGNVTGNTSGSAGSCTGNSATVTNGVYTTNFTGSNQSIATNGYQKLVGGLIMQWGFSTCPSSSGSVTYPIAFPTACLNIQVSSLSNSTDTGGLSALAAVRTTTITTTGFDLTTPPDSSTNSKGFYWFAIGY